MALTEGQWSVRGLVMGPGTSYTVLPGTNPWARSVRADQSGTRAREDGGYSGAEFLNPTTVPFRVVVKANDMASWLTAYNELQAAFDAVGEGAQNQELRFNIGGDEYVMFGRPRMVEPSTSAIALGHSTVRATFQAIDSRIYSDLNTIANIPLPVEAGGLLVPFTLPTVLGGGLLGGRVETTNSGKAPARLLWRIDGPVPDPRVTVVGPDGGIQTVVFFMELDDGEWLTVDTRDRTVYLNGNPEISRRNTAEARPTPDDWPLLKPGTSEITFRADDHNDQARLTVSWRDTW